MNQPNQEDVLVCDIDGTIWSLFNFQRDFVNRYTDMHITEDSVNSWSYFYDELPTSTADDLFAYCLHPMRMEEREIYEGVEETLMAFQSLLNVKTIFLSHNERPTYMQPATEQWLQDKFPELDFDLLMVPSDVCKVNLLDRLPVDVVAFIEDKPATIRKGAEHGLPMKILSKAYNQDVIGLKNTEIWQWQTS